MHPNHHEQET